MSPTVALWALWALWVVCPSPIAAQPSAAPQPGAQQPGALDAARARWDGLSGAERGTLLERFEELQRLSPEERGALLEQARALDALKREVHAELGPEERDALGALVPEERDAALRDHVLERARQLGRGLEAKLPLELARSIEHAPPFARPHLLQKYLEKELPKVSDRAIDLLGAKLGLEPAALAELRVLPPRQRADAMLHLVRRSIEREVEQGGLPPAVDEAAWIELQRASDREFLLGWKALVPRLPGMGRPGTGHAGIGPPGVGSRDGPDAVHPDATGDGSRHQGERNSPRDEVELVRELDRLLRPRLTDFVAARGRPLGEREEAVAAAVRARVVAFLVERGMATEGERGALEDLRGSAFGDMARERLREHLGLPPR